MSIWRDPSGKASMARLVAFLLTTAAYCLTLAVVYGIVRQRIDGTVVGAAAACLTALVGGGCVAILNRVRDRNGNG